MEKIESIVQQLKYQTLKLLNMIWDAELLIEEHREKDQ